jgi:hypothetical protein
MRQHLHLYHKDPIQMRQHLHLYHTIWIRIGPMDEVPQLVLVLDLLHFNVLVVKQQILLIPMAEIFVQHVDALLHFESCLPFYLQ